MLIDQCHLPRSHPAFEIFLALNGGSYVIVGFDMNQHVQSITTGEPGLSLLMLINTRRQIRRDADVEHAAHVISHDINVAAGGHEE